MVARKQHPGVFDAGKPAWNRRKPARYAISDKCSRLCTLNPSRLPGPLQTTFHSWFEQALTDYEIGVRSDQVGHHVSFGAISRHRRNHLILIETVADIESSDPLRPADPGSVDHVSVLERIIAHGSRNIETGKITTELVLKAMDMHWRITAGRQLDATMQAIEDAMSGAGRDVGSEALAATVENDESVRSPAERAMSLAAGE